MTRTDVLLSDVIEGFFITAHARRWSKHTQRDYAEQAEYRSVLGAGHPEHAALRGTVAGLQPVSAYTPTARRTTAPLSRAISRLSRIVSSSRATGQRVSGSYPSSVISTVSEWRNPPNPGR